MAGSHVMSGGFGIAGSLVMADGFLRGGVYLTGGCLTGGRRVRFRRARRIFL